MPDVMYFSEEADMWVVLRILTLLALEIEYV